MRRIFATLKSPLFYFVIGLSFIGLINLNSATLGFQSEGFSSYFKSQILYHGVGIFLMFSFANIREKTLFRLSPWLYAVALLLLVMVLIFGVEVNGAKSWLHFGSVRFQPSEFAKLALILFLSRFLAALSFPGPLGARDLFQPIFIGTLPMALVIMQNDLGSSLFFALALATLLLFQGIRWPLLLTTVILVIIACVFAYHFALKEHHKNRIVSFMHPELDAKKTGYHLVQSKITVGSGQLWGKGYLQGKYHKLKFLPERHTDFIFPVLAEEWGFVGSVVTLIFYLLLFLSGVLIANRSSTRFGFFLSLGFTALFFWHVVINLGGVLGLIPLTGVPLPFLSYGGSSIIMVWIALGMIFAIRHEKGMFQK